MNSSTFLTCAWTLCSLLTFAGTAQATIISLNFSVNGNDNNAVDAGETAVNGIAGVTPTDGSVWTNFNIAGTPGTPTAFTTATQGGNSLTLNDDSGNASAATLTSTGAFHSNWSNVDTPGRGLTGDGGMMQSYLNAGNAESLTFSNLGSAFTGGGYEVYIYSDIGTAAPDRTYGFRVTDGLVDQSFYTIDRTGIDVTDPGTNGIMNWIQATGTSAGSATENGNYMRFTGLTADSFTLSNIHSPDGRGAINAIQIVAIVPEPASLGLLLLGGILVGLRRRR